ncbi:hypothetical protein H3N56_02765 [Cetobacterium sp. 2A]|uniref:phage tail protein n=1 Tax=Cetobacterium sp. 2A TaxID=2754723 RepID=UPI00163C7202|nr:phage tail protein [Cetobacterium sp. 2A]MBC2855352.1 hypothetical protein [Cetobacterium sp. 2A]MBC2855416.1 hypothetical protein [Cetobacterium sp. 2A]
MRTIFEENILKLSPKLAKDKYEDIFKVCELLIQNFLISQIKRLVHFDRIDEMEEFELDLLSKELHIDYYNPKYTLEEKRKVCNDSLQTHMKKGTVGAINTLLGTFFKGAKVNQWHEVGLNPGYFNINISDASINESIEDILKMIETTKKKSQHISQLTKNGKVELNLNFATGIYTHKEKTIIGDFNI